AARAVDMQINRAGLKYPRLLTVRDELLGSDAPAADHVIKEYFDATCGQCADFIPALAICRIDTRQTGAGVNHHRPAHAGYRLVLPLHLASLLCHWRRRNQTPA